MLKVVLFEPEIPPNTGNIIRLCANTGCELHLVEPLGFDLEDRKMRRAGLDYREFARVQVHPNLQDCLQHCLAHDPSQHPGHDADATSADAAVYAVSTKGATAYHEVSFKAGDILLFGPETRGLPRELLASMPASQTIRIPMRDDSRSLNLSNAVALVLYEGLRQLGFQGLQ